MSRRVGVSYANAPLGTRPPVYFAFTGDGRVKKVNSKKKRRRRKKKKKKRAEELVLRYNKLFPSIDLSVIYACVLQYKHNDTQILKQLTAYSRAEMDERLMQEKVEELRQTFSNTPVAILRQALERKKMDIGEASVWIVENGHVEIVSSNRGSGGAGAPPPPAVPFQPPAGANPRDQLALTQSTILTDMNEELGGLRTRKEAVLAALRSLQARVQDLSVLSQSFSMMRSTLHEEDPPAAKEEEDEGEESDVEWETDDEDDFEPESASEEEGQHEAAEVVDAPVVRIADGED